MRMIGRPSSYVPRDCSVDVGGRGVGRAVLRVDELEEKDVEEGDEEGDGSPEEPWQAAERVAVDVRAQNVVRGWGRAL